MDKNPLRRYTILKWIPSVLLLALIGFSTYVFLSYKEEDRRSSDPKADKVARVEQVVNKVDYSHFDKERLVYRVRAKKNVRLKNDQQELEQPEFIFYDENQKETIRITGKRCIISKDFNTITVIDDTLVRSQEGMTVASRVLKYERRLEQFSTPAPARFHWRTLTGRSDGFVYLINDELLILHENPELRYTKEGAENRKPVVVVGERGAIDRKNGFAYFDGNVQVTQGKDKITADRIEVVFTPGSNDLEKITGVANVHVRFGRPEQAAASPETEVSPEMQKKQPPGMSNLFVTEGSSAKELDADHVELFFYEDGSTIRSFHSKGNCILTLRTFNQEEKPSEDRIIKGETFTAGFDGQGDMSQFNATENVTVQVQPLGARKEHVLPQTIHCKNLAATFVPQTGDVKEIHFNDSFRHIQGKRTVSSQKAIYFGSQKKTDLIGNPEIEDATFRVKSDSMELFEETSGIRAQGNVKSSFVRSEGKTPMTFPFSSPSNQPVYISADHMDWDAQKSQAIYTGKAKLWQEKNVISAAKMIINDKEKTLSAYEKVHTIFYNKRVQKPDPQKENKLSPETASTTGNDQRQEGTDAETEQQQASVQSGSDPNQTFSQAATEQTQTSSTEGKEDAGKEEQNPSKENLLFDDEEANEGPISVDADIMNYVEEDRVVHFEDDVKVVTPSTRINSDKADFHLKEKSSEFDRLYAQGRVVVLHGQKRGVGQKATFFADEHRLVLEGSPRLSETGRADIVGQMLTLFLSDGRMLIDGYEDGRATTTLEMGENSLPPVKPVKPTTDSAADAGSKNEESN